MALLKKKDKGQEEARVSDYSVLLEPVITEKSSVIGSLNNTVVFRIAPTASKTDVKRAVESIFKVEVDYKLFFS